MQRTMAFDYALDFLGGAVEPAEALVRGMDWRAGGKMEVLGIPRECMGLHWGRLEETTIPQMPRPCKPGQRCRFNSYHPDTETIEKG